MSRTSRLLALFFVVVLGVSALYVSLPGAPVAQAQGPAGTITPASTTLTNDGSQGTVTVEVLNGGAPVQGASVAVAVASVPSPLPAGVTLSALNGTTGADGRFNVTVSYLPATSETLQLTFTASATVGGNPVPVAGSAVVNFVKAPASPTFSIVSLADATLGAVPADNFSETRIVVQLRDSQRRSPGAKRVRLELESGTTDGLTPALPVEADTDSAGNFTFAVKSSLPKDVVFRVFNVTDNFMVQGRPSVSFYAAPPTAISTVTVTPDPANVLGNGVDLATITVTAKGQGGNALEGVQVTLNGLDAFYNGGDTAPKTTGPDGRAVFTVSSGRTDLNRVFTVTLQRTGPGGGSPVTLNVPAINFTAAPAIEANSSISAPPGSVPADNTATKVITVFVRNQGNFGIPGKEVRLTASSPDVTITPSVPTFLTDNEGKIEFTVSSRAAGDVTFTTNQIDGFTKSIIVNFTAAPTDPVKSTIARDPTGDIPSDGSRVLVTVTLVNAGMLPVTGHTVVLNPEPTTLQAIQDALIIETAPDGNPADNNYLFYVSAVAPNALGNVQFQATDVTSGVTLSTLLTINFIAPSVSVGNSRVDVVGEPPSALLSVVADNTATATIRVTVKDANGNPLPGRSVTLIADNANVTITPSTPTQTSGAVGSEGVATFTARSSAVALVTFTAQVAQGASFVEITDKGQVQFVDAPITQTTIAYDPTPPQAPANGTSFIKILVTVRNAGGPAIGKILELEPVAGPGVDVDAIVYRNSLRQAASQAPNGVATFEVASRVAQTVTFNIINRTDPPQTQSIGTATVTFTASSSPISGANSTINVQPTTVNADGVEQATITVVLRDANNTVIQGQTVQLRSNPSPLPATAQLTPSITPSNASGELVWTLTSTAPGTFSFDALAGTQAIVSPPPGGSTSVTFNPVGSPVSATQSLVEVTNNSSPALANGTDTVTIRVTLRDNTGAPIDGKTVELISDRGGTDTISAPQATAGGGIANFTVRSSTVGSAIITARVQGDNVTLATRPTIRFNNPNSAVDADRSTITMLQDTAIADGLDTVRVRVTLLQADGTTPVANQDVTLRTSRGSLVDTVSPAFDTSDASGVAEFTITSTQAGTGVVIAQAQGVELAARPGYRFNSIVSPVSDTQSLVEVVEGDNQALANGTDAVIIRVTIKNNLGTGLPNYPVTLTTTPAVQVAVADATNRTNNDGQVRFRLTSTVAHPEVVVTAASDGVTVLDDARVAFVPLPPSTATSTITATPSSLLANGIAMSTITVTLKDTNGNNIAGKTVVIGSSRNSQGTTVDTINPGSRVTGTNGQATFTIQSTTEGVAVVNIVSVDGAAFSVPDANAARVSFVSNVAVSGADSTLAVVGSNNAAANGTSSVQVCATVRSNPTTTLQGREVVLGAQPTGVTFSPTTNLSDANGQACFNLTSTTPGQRTISASANGVAFTGANSTVTVNFTAVADLSRTTISPMTSQQAVGTPVSITVTVRDSQGTGLAQKNVTLRVTPNQNVTVGPNTTQSTGNGGIATFTVNSTTPGIYSITVEVDGQAVPNLTAQTTFTEQLGPPNLAITKSAQSSFNAGVASPFILTVNNVGGPTTGTITITDNLPIGMRYWGTLGDTQGFSCGANGQTVTCTRGQALAQGGVAVVQVLANPDPAVFGAPQNLSNTATVNTTGDTDATNNTSTAFFTVAPLNPNQIFEGNSTVTVNPTQVPADNNSTANITITLRNIQSQGVAGATVSLTPSVATGVTVASTTPTTDGNGTITFTAKSSVNQTVQFTIIATSSAGSVTFNNKPQVVFGTGGTGGTGGGTGGTAGVTSPTTSTVLADCSSIPANNVAQAIIQVTLKDANNNPVAGKAVTLTANPAPATLLLTPVSGTTSGADGTVRWTVRSSAQGSSIFTASTTDGQLIFINQTATVTFGAPNSQSACTGLPTATGTAVAGVTDPNLLTVPTGPITGRVVAWRLRVRTGPGLDYQILGLLRLGTEVSIVARNSRTTWFMIQLNEGTAWVSAYWIRVTRSAVRRLPVVDDQPGTAPIVPVPTQLIPLVGEGIGRINTYLLRVRVGPGLEYQQVGLLREGTEVLLLGISPNRAWYKIRTDDGDRWVSAFYVRVIRINGQRLPVVEPEPRP